jgi:hypothetical protein
MMRSLTVTVAEMKQLAASVRRWQAFREQFRPPGPRCRDGSDRPFGQPRAMSNHQSLPKTSPPLGVTAPQKVDSETCRETVRTLPSASPTSIPAE